MTKFRLEHDQKFFTMRNLNNWILPKIMTTTNINFTPKKYAGAVGLDRFPILASPVTLLLYKKKISSTEVRSTPSDIMKVCQFQFWWSCSIVNVCCCRDSVIFILSSWFDHVSIPLTKDYWKLLVSSRSCNISLKNWHWHNSLGSFCCKVSLPVINELGPDPFKWTKCINGALNSLKHPGTIL